MNRQKLKNTLKRFGQLLFQLCISFVLLSLIVVILYRHVNPPITGMMVYKKAGMGDEPIQYQWEDLDGINKNVPIAFMAAEDQHFLEHFGFDLEAIKQASIRNTDKSGPIRGGSTISQQVAKNLFLFPTKSLLRKGVEAYFTLLIELIWPKCRIIEMYVNIVELAPGIYGTEAAAQHFFRKPANELTQAEAALMATVLPNPSTFDLAHPSAYMLKRRKWISKQIFNLGGEEVFKACY